MTRSLLGGLQTLLDTRATTMVHCWKVIRTDGTIQGFTECDIDLTFDGTTFLADAGFTATKIDSSLGLSVDNLDVQGALSSNTINEGDLAAGVYDNAEVELFWVNFNDTAMRVLLSKGNLGQVKRGEFAFTAELRSQSHRLQQSTGRIYSKTCDAIFGDTRCNANTASFDSTGTVSSVSNNRKITVTGLSNDTRNFYTFGLLTFTSGNNDGLSFEVKRHDVGVLTLWDQPPYSIAASDTFNVIAGCDKYHTTCQDKFSNIINFRGFPYIPGNDTLTKYAKKDGSQKGQSIYR